MEIGNYIKFLREKRGISQRHLAQLCGVSNTEINRIENNERKNPSPGILKKIAPHLGVLVDELMERAGYLSGDTHQENNNIVRRLSGRIGKLSPESQKKLEQEIVWLEEIERKMRNKKKN